MANLLQRDATITDALPTITAKEEFLRLIVGNLAECKRLHGNAMVRIGVTGGGAVPYNRISYLNGSGTEVASGAFLGGAPFKNAARVDDDSWSSAAMTLPEVQALLGEIRKFKPNHPAPEPHISSKGHSKRAI